MAGELVKVDGVWNLDAKTAQRLGMQPNELKKYFVKEYVIPYVLRQRDKLNLKTKTELSSARKGFGKINFMGKNLSIQSLNEFFRRHDKGERTAPSQLLGSSEKSGNRDLYALGFSELGEKQAAFYDKIDVYRKQLENSLNQAKGPRQESRAYGRFDSQMQKLFKANKQWLPQDAFYDPNMADTYGWTKGSSREGYLAWQKQVYTQAQNEARAIAKEYGIDFDAGHALALGKYKMSKEEFDSYDIPLKQLIRDGAEPDPDNKGGWILHGTNSASNLAVEVAKINQAKKNFSPVAIRDLLKLNTAFTKTGSLQEYLTRNDLNYRKNTDFNRKIRSLFSHSKNDINAILSQGEDELLDTGIVPAEQYKIKGRQLNILPDVTQGGEVTTFKGDIKALNSQYSNVGRFARVPDGKGGFQLFDPNTGTMFGLPQLGPNETLGALKGLAEFGLEHSVNLLGAQAGNPQIGTQIKAGVETVQAVKDKDPLKAIMSIHRAVSPGITIQEPYYKAQPSHKLVGR